MAKFKSSTFGKISGKHGDVVAVTMKDGTTYFRAHIIPPNPNTAKQQTQRGKFGFVVKELNCMRGVFTVTFGGQYGINRAVSLAMKTCVSGNSPDFRIDYSLLSVALGSLALPVTFNMEKLTTNAFKLTWVYDELMNEGPIDEANVVILNNTLKQVIHLQNRVLRSCKTLNFIVPDSWQASEIHVWLYFSASNNSHFSDSKYMGALIV
jgi:hypothetical protein